MPSPCAPFRESLSAMADGEAAPVDVDAVRDHVDGCEPCTVFAAALPGLDRRFRLAPAEPVPDLTARILAAVPTPGLDRARARLTQLRAVLALTGAVQLLLLLPVLLAGDLFAGHATREAGIFQLALGVGFLVVAARPSRSGGLLPVAAVVAALATVTSIGDVVGGSASLLQETVHVLEVVGTGVLWWLHRHDGTATLRPVTT